MHNELKKHGIIMSLDEDIGISFFATKVSINEQRNSMISEQLITSTNPNLSSVYDSIYS